MPSHLPLKYHYLKSFFNDKKKKIFLCLKCTILIRLKFLVLSGRKRWIILHNFVFLSYLLSKDWGIITPVLQFIREWRDEAISSIFFVNFHSIQNKVPLYINGYSINGTDRKNTYKIKALSWRELDYFGQNICKLQ